MTTRLPDETPLKPWPEAPYEDVRLERIAHFPDRQVTGVAVASSGRIFVALPRLTTENVPISLGEVVDGEIVPYPKGTEWNGYRMTNGDAERQFVCAQAVVMDNRDHLWVLDSATPKGKGPVAGGPKLVKINVIQDRVIDVFHFDRTASPEGSSLNDVRFSPDGNFAYLSDPGAKTGAIVVMDLRTREAWRVLHGDASTQADPSVQLSADGKPLATSDGKQIAINIDGIEISPDGETFYWQALTGKTLYAVPTAVLRDRERAASARPEVVATTHAADGLWIDRTGRFFVSNPGEDSIEVAENVGAPLRLLVKDKQMRWPDSFSQASDGSLYVIASFMADSPWFKQGSTTTPSSIFRIVSERRAAPD